MSIRARVVVVVFVSLSLFLCPFVVPVVVLFSLLSSTTTNSLRFTLRRGGCDRNGTRYRQRQTKREKALEEKELKEKERKEGDSTTKQRDKNEHSYSQPHFHMQTFPPCRHGSDSAARHAASVAC